MADGQHITCYHHMCTALSDAERRSELMKDVPPTPHWRIVLEVAGQSIAEMIEGSRI